MATTTDPYSRLVTILKILLPLIAIGLLSSLFLVRDDDGGGGEIIFSEGDLEELGSGLQISNPVFSGSSRNDDQFRFQAELVVPDAVPPTRARITALSGAVTSTDGSRLELESSAASLDIGAQTLVLDGEVTIASSDGYRIETDRLDVDLGSGGLESRQPIEATGPLGRIESGSFTLAPALDGADDRRFVFGNGVRVLYDPPEAETQSPP